MTADLIPDISIGELEQLFDDGQFCEYRKDKKGLAGSDLPSKCSLPATWVWVFEVSCEHASSRHYLCATHHVLFSEAFSEGDAWRCMRCSAAAFVKEKRRVR